MQPGRGERLAMISNFLLMVVFFGVTAAIPLAWFLVGLNTYGTGDYPQP